MARLNDIRERLQKTTKGKWKAYLTENEHCILCEQAPNEEVWIAECSYDNQSISMNHNVKDDTIFIANAKCDIEYLLNYIEALEGRTKDKSNSWQWEND